MSTEPCFAMKGQGCVDSTELVGDNKDAPQSVSALAVKEEGHAGSAEVTSEEIVVKEEEEAGDASESTNTPAVGLGREDCKEAVEGVSEEVVVKGEDAGGSNEPVNIPAVKGEAANQAAEVVGEESCSKEEDDAISTTESANTPVELVGEDCKEAVEVVREEVVVKGEDTGCVNQSRPTFQP